MVVLDQGEEHEVAIFGRAVNFLESDDTGASSIFRQQGLEELELGLAGVRNMVMKSTRIPGDERDGRR
eukprot:7590105-Heterocapsa_arctica.AAC.1